MSLASSPSPGENSEFASRVRQIIAVAGSRGGAGTSLVALNLSVYLAQLGRTVVLVDASPAGAFAHSLLGVSSRVLHREDSDRLRPLETSVPGLLLEPQCYAVGLTQPSRPGRRPRWSKELRGLAADHVVLDLGTGTNPPTLELLLQADSNVVVTTPEPSGVEGTYRLFRALYQRKLRRALGKDRHHARVLERALSSLPPLPSPKELIQALSAYDVQLGARATRELRPLRPRLIVNGARLRNHYDLGQAMRDLSHRYLGVLTEYVGHIEQDDAVWLSTAHQRPLLIDSPASKAARNLERIARRLVALGNSHDEKASVSAGALSPEPTLYDILLTHPAASDDELRKAYRRQREIFEPGSLPLSSLLEGAELSSQRALVEEAHDTLLDPVKRRAYDLSTFPDRPAEQVGPSAEEDAARRAERELLQQQLASELSEDTRFSGELLRKVRQARGISLDDIARRTKINRIQLRAIEEEEFASLPAFVYLRGFVQEVARVLELDPTQVARTYLKRYASWRADVGGGARG